MRAAYGPLAGVAGADYASAMRTPLPTRRLVGGVLRALLAVLLVLARLAAPAMATSPNATLAEFDRLAREAICHVPADGAGDPAREPPAGHGDCLLCPACHFAAAAVLPAPPCPALPAPASVAGGLPAPPPPATGPPCRKRAATPPTGPPPFSA